MLIKRKKGERWNLAYAKFYIFRTDDDIVQKNQIRVDRIDIRQLA